MVGSAGAGIAGRGLMGLYNLLSPQKDVVGPKVVGQGVMPVPYPTETEEEEAEEKAANALSSFISGDQASTPTAIPWFMPAAMLGGLGTIYGGWKGMDKILDARRKAKLEEEVEDARGDFNQALLDQYDEKAGSDEATLGQDLDTLFDQVEKVAFGNIDWGNLSGTTAGLYGSYAGLTALLAGLTAHDFASKRSKRELLRKAQQRKARRLQMQRPSELFATPVPVPKPSRTAPDADEQEGDPLDKVAACQ
jgi:hypothetical protein